MSIASPLMLAAMSGQLPKEDEARCVVRLTTNCFISGGRATFSKVISRLKRKSQLNFDEISFDYDAEIDFSAIINLMDVEDGLYCLDPHEVEYGEWEDGGSWAISWKLVPYQE